MGISKVRWADPGDIFGVMSIDSYTQGQVRIQIYITGGRGGEYCTLKNKIPICLINKSVMGVFKNNAISRQMSVSTKWSGLYKLRQYYKLFKKQTLRDKVH